MNDHTENRSVFAVNDLAQLEDWLHSGQIELALTYDVGLPAEIGREVLAELRPYGLVPAGSKLARGKAGRFFLTAIA